MDFELFQYAFFFAVIAVLYVIGNTLVGLFIINYHNANITNVIRMNLIQIRETRIDSPRFKRKIWISIRPREIDKSL